MGGGGGKGIEKLRIRGVRRNGGIVSVSWKYEFIVYLSPITDVYKKLLLSRKEIYRFLYRYYTKYIYIFIYLFIVYDART